MKIRKIIKVAPVFAGMAITLGVILKPEGGEKNYVSRDTQYIAQSPDGFELIAQQTVNFFTGQVEVEDVLRAQKEVAALRNRKSIGLTWEEQGPDNVGGRTRAILVDRNDDNILYAGSVSGGLFKSTNAGGLWKKVESFTGNQCISSLAQLGDGTLIVGTGSVWEPNTTTTIAGSAGFTGKGVYVSENGTDFSVLESSTGFKYEASAAVRSQAYSLINEIVVDESNPMIFWMATNAGLIKFNYSTKTEITRFSNGSSCEEVAISKDGQTILTTKNRIPFLSKDGGNTFNSLSSLLPTVGSGRADVAISPDDKNYMYICAANGSGGLDNIYGSNDGGNSWEVVCPGVSGYNIFDQQQQAGGGQGNYDNVITVIPGQPGVCIAGGIDLWRVGLEAQPEQLSLWYAAESSPIYVHADNHEMTWDSKGRLYIGNDGGVHRTANRGNTFERLNKGYNVTQFYAMDFDNEGRVIGGAQDNGTQMLKNLSGNLKQSAVEVRGGDGFDCYISKLDSRNIIASVYSGDIARSNDRGALNFEGFYSTTVCKLISPELTSCTSGLGGFNTTFDVWETHYNPLSRDTLLYVNESSDTIKVGQELIVNSPTSLYPFKHTFTEQVNPGSEVKVWDPVGSIFVASFGTKGIWMTREALKFDRIPVWYRIANTTSFNDNALEIQFSVDGEACFIGTIGGKLIRVDGLNNAWTKKTSSIDSAGTALSQATIFTTSGSINGISTDPNDPNHLVVCRGNSNAGPRVYETFDALAPSPTFTDISGDLPSVVCFDVQMDVSNPERILVGTTVGIFSTNDGGASWAYDSEGLGAIPVLDLEQQYRWAALGATNSGVVYAGTYGRGFFKSSSLATGIAPKGRKEVAHSFVVYPNPVSTVGTVKLTGNSMKQATLKLYSVTGKLVLNKLVDFSAGTVDFNVSNLNTGSYIIVLESDSKRLTEKIVVTK